MVITGQKKHKPCTQCLVESEMCDRFNLRCMKLGCRGDFPMAPLLQDPAIGIEMQAKYDSYMDAINEVSDTL